MLANTIRHRTLANLVLLPFVGCLLAAGANVSADEMPAEHRALHEKLSQQVTLNFEDASPKEIVASLSESLGAPIRFEKGGALELHYPEAMKGGAQVTHWRALEMLIIGVGRQNSKITFDNRGLVIFEAYTDASRGRPYLQRHNLSEFADYTTAKRRRLIQRIQSEVAPDTWDNAAGRWVVPSASVYEIDVFQTREVHDQIANFRRTASQAELYTEAQRKQQLEHGLILQAFWEKGQLGIEEEKEKKDEPISAETKEAFEKLRAAFPFQSLADELKELEPALALERSKPKLTEAAARRLDEREGNIGKEGYKKINFSGWREASLKKLHNENVAEFISTEGFGLSRISPPGPSNLYLRPAPRFALPSADALPAGEGESIARIPQTDVEAATAVTPLPTKDVLTAFHTQGEKSFLSPYQFGYFKDRDHVAGFQSHAFTRLPRMSEVDGKAWNAERTEHWALRRLELVSLLKHKQPAVYISDELPRMEDLDEAPTRKLTDFEAAALESLIEGEDVVARATTNRIEMVGSLRSIKQCADCHDAERGTLLGAFSYELVRDPMIDAPRLGE